MMTERFLKGYFSFYIVMSNTTTLDERMEEEPREKDTLVAHLMPQAESLDCEGHEDYTEAVKINLEYYEIMGAEAALVFNHNKRLNSNYLAGFMKNQLISDGDFYLLNDLSVNKMIPRLKDDLREAGQNEVYIFYEEDHSDNLKQALESEDFVVKYKE